MNSVVLCSSKRRHHFFSKVSSCEEGSASHLTPSAKFSDWQTITSDLRGHEYGKLDWTNGWQTYHKATRLYMLAGILLQICFNVLLWKELTATIQSYFSCCNRCNPAFLLCVLTTFDPVNFWESKVFKLQIMNCKGWRKHSEGFIFRTYDLNRWAF